MKNALLAVLGMIIFAGLMALRDSATSPGMRALLAALAFGGGAAVSACWLRRRNGADRD